uniref:Uncharacterized protein n=1 Tax=Rhizophora mucronata TaxID=61149 RepID=A0A2P2R2Z7_RHIMU
MQVFCSCILLLTSTCLLDIVL